MLDVCRISMGVDGLGEQISDEVGEGAPGLEAKVSGRLFLRNDIGEELPEGSFMGVKAVNGGCIMVKLFLRRLSDIM